MNRNQLEDFLTQTGLTQDDILELCERMRSMESNLLLSACRFCYASGNPGSE